MNLSPFCTLNANSVLPKWQSAVNETYGVSGNGLEYISGLPSPIRKEYKKQVRGREILSSLSEVFFQFKRRYLILRHFQENPAYNAYEKDIAVVNIFFGQSTAFGKSI